MADITCDPTDPRLGHGSDDKPVSQNEAYLVDCDVTKKPVRPFRNTYTHLKCSTDTTMSDAIAKTYQINPHFYGSTYCVNCQMHRPLSEFVWKNTNEIVGS